MKLLTWIEIACMVAIIWIAVDVFFLLRLHLLSALEHPLWG